jgi:hypothetical protein
MPKSRIKLHPPHLDSPIPQDEAERITSDPALVASHPFYPFLEKSQHWTKFAKKGTEKSKVRVKDRPIRYAAKLDSFIYSHYRDILYRRYEPELESLGLTQCVLAYRHIALDSGKGGKCNVHFADRAFKETRSFGNCLTIALDIEKFFENLDHEWIKQMWWRLLGKPVPTRRGLLLPEDHFNVFKAVTQYSFIRRDMAYKKLGYIAEEHSSGKRKRWRFTRSKEDFPSQICGPKRFREELQGLINRNRNPFGIPQGSPISDLLANVYMIDFDQEMNQFVSSLGGKYFRYSDDILIIAPGQTERWQDVLSATQDTLKKTAPRLQLKGEKTQVHAYKPINGGPDQECSLLVPPRGPNGMEYLGFRYDGKGVFLRNSTVSGFQRKITAAANKMAQNHVVHNPAKSLDQLIKSFNYNVLIRKFGRVKGFEFSGREYTKWTFWTYVRKSAKILGVLGAPLVRQVNGYKAFARKKAKIAIETSYKHAH